ncbi:50S ribosomal protein L32 [Proteinivorax tanatarense]|uniref:Large ribosomal subunit protein bL32 n=1 Tax=Proteinivorax tanatarense TaxID=1260629 RepID=A0AAU7VQ64_9FIRM
MAVPKRRHSKARQAKRRANWKLNIPGSVSCPQCHEPKLPHRVCQECGFYKGKQVIEVEK